MFVPDIADAERMNEVITAHAEHLGVAPIAGPCRLLDARIRHSHRPSSPRCQGWATYSVPVDGEPAALLYVRGYPASAQPWAELVATGRAGGAIHLPRARPHRLEVPRGSLAARAPPAGRTHPDRRPAPHRAGGGPRRPAGDAGRGPGRRRPLPARGQRHVVLPRCPARSGAGRRVCQGGERRSHRDRRRPRAVVGSVGRPGRPAHRPAAGERPHPAGAVDARCSGSPARRAGGSRALRRRLPAPSPRCTTVVFRCLTWCARRTAWPKGARRRASSPRRCPAAGRRWRPSHRPTAGSDPPLAHRVLSSTVTSTSISSSTARTAPCSSTSTRWPPATPSSTSPSWWWTS